MIEHINIIDALYDQIASLLDLIQCCNETCVDIGSIHTAADMAATMLVDLKAEVDKIQEEYK